MTQDKKKAGGKLLEDVRVFDAYRGKGVPEGQVSLALRFRLRAPDRTLTDEEIGGARDKIVGALANEGGFRREDFGAIQIRPDFSLVELPADLPPGTLKRLENTRISGRLIEIKPDRFQRSAKRPERGDRGDRGDRPRRRYDD